MYKNNNKSQNENSKQLPFAAIFIQQQPLEHSFSVSLQQKNGEWEAFHVAPQEITTSCIIRNNDNKNHLMQMLGHDAGGGLVILSDLILERARRLVRFKHC